MLIRQISALATARRAHDEAFLDEERLTDLLDGAGVLAHRRGDGVDTHRAALELIDDGREDLVVHVVKAVLVHVEGLQADAGNVDGDGTVALDLGEVADTAQQQVGNTRRATTATGNLEGRRVVDGHTQDARRALHDL